MATLHRHRSTILSTAALVLLGLLLGFALHPLQVAAVPPGQAANGLEGRVTALEQFALDADVRLDDLELDVNQLVIDLTDLMILVEELQACTGCEGGGGGGGGGCVPTGEEICNGRDDDCDGLIDEGFENGRSCDAGGGPGSGVFFNCACHPLF